MRREAASFPEFSVHRNMRLKTLKYSWIFLKFPRFVFCLMPFNHRVRLTFVIFLFIGLFRWKRHFPPHLRFVIDMSP